MSKKHKHQAAIDVLRSELCKIAGEIFERTFVTEALKEQAKNGSEEAEKELGMIDFMYTLLGSKTASDEATEKFHSILASIHALSLDA